MYDQVMNAVRSLEEARRESEESKPQESEKEKGSKRKHIKNLQLKSLTTTTSKIANLRVPPNKSAVTDPRLARMAGVLVPLFALRSENDWGVGDLHSLRRFLDWAERAGLSFVQLLPINECGPDNSPYNVISSTALDPTTFAIDETYLPELGSEDIQEARELLDIEDPLKINYQNVKLVKMSLFKKAFHIFWENRKDGKNSRNDDFETFCALEQNWLSDYCVFRFFMDEEGGSNDWPNWDKKYNKLSKAKAEIQRLLTDKKRDVDTEERLAFYAYLQWLGYKQWRDFAEYAAEKNILLMGDIPFGIGYCSADVFCQPEIFDLDWSAGAPPETNFQTDAFTQKWGQNWGMPLYRWHEKPEATLAWHKRRLTKCAEIFSMIRLDHILGFYRVYAFPWRPEKNDEMLKLNENEVKVKCKGELPRFHERSDENPQDAHSNQVDGESRLEKILSATPECLIIGEDLGFVPKYMRSSLQKLGIYNMIVPQWEYENHNLKSSEDYHENAYAIYATHDHAPISVQWSGLRSQINGTNTENKESAMYDMENWLRLAGLKAEQKNNPPECRDATLAKLRTRLCRSKAKIICFMLQDIFGTKEIFNVPGSISEENWSTRCQISVDELENDIDRAYQTAKLRLLFHESNRLKSLDEQS